MDNFSSSDLVNRMEDTLKEAINHTLNNFDPKHQDFKQEIVKSVNAKMEDLSSRLSFYFRPFSEIEIKNFSYSPTACNNEGIMIGNLEVAYCNEPDFVKYAGPGYPGKENGQLCEYPEYSRQFYKWNDFLCRWEDIYKDIDRRNDRQSWYNKLTNNAAFEPWWGTNNSGGNYLRSDRQRNGADDLWGDPGVRKSLGTFKQISADVMKSIFRFTLNLKSAIGHYEKISNAFGFGEEEGNLATSNSNDVYTAEEEPKVSIKIKKVNRWEVGMAFGQYYESGIMVEKDSLVYLKDVNKADQFYKEKNERIKQETRANFKQKK